MITEVHADIFTVAADVLVCPVNSVGVMGAGLAKQVRVRRPAVFDGYRTTILRPGQSVLVNNGPGDPRRHTLCVATKDHWKDPSELPWIADCLKGIDYWMLGLKTQRGVCNRRESTPARLRARSVAVPRLGCGLGGLRWEVVRQMCYETFIGAPYDVYLVHNGS